MFTLGLDMFLRTGFLENYKSLFSTADNIPYQIYGGIYGMLGVLSLAFLVGFLVQIPLFFIYKRNQRAKARANAVPALNSPYGQGYNRDNNRDSRYRDSGYRDSQYRDSQYRDSQYRDSQYGGSQYGSRDQLNTTYGNQAAVPVKKEYNWWGKRTNKDANQGGYDNEKYNYQNQNNLGPRPHLQVPQQQQQQGYHQSAQQPVGQQQAAFQQQPVRQQQPMGQQQPMEQQQPVLQQQSAFQQQPVIQQQPAAVQQPSFDQPSVVQPQQQPVAAQQLGSTATTVGGDKSVVFEEKKNWLGRKKLVPKFSDAASSTANNSQAADTTTSAPPALA